jgi:hypothetical protein
VPIESLAEGAVVASVDPGEPDIGFYFAEVVLTNIPGTRWDQPLRGRTLADYGQPVLVGLRPIPTNPMRVMITIARGFADGSEPDDAIPKLYERWAADRR